MHDSRSEYISLHMSVSNNPTSHSKYIHGKPTTHIVLKARHLSGSAFCWIDIGFVGLPEQAVGRFILGLGLVVGDTGAAKCGPRGRLWPPVQFLVAPNQADCTVIIMYLSVFSNL